MKVIHGHLTEYEERILNEMLCQGLTHKASNGFYYEIKRNGNIIDFSTTVKMTSISSGRNGTTTQTTNVIIEL